MKTILVAIIALIVLTFSTNSSAQTFSRLNKRLGIRLAQRNTETPSSQQDQSRPGGSLSDPGDPALGNREIPAAVPAPVMFDPNRPIRSSVVGSGTSVSSSSNGEQQNKRTQGNLVSSSMRRLPTPIQDPTPNNYFDSPVTGALSDPRSLVDSGQVPGVDSGQSVSLGDIGQPNIENYLDRNAPNDLFGTTLQYRIHFEYDLLLLKYNKEGGTAVGQDIVAPGNDLADFDLKLSHRGVARIALDNKYHLKARAFRYDGRQATNLDPTSSVDMDTYYVDLMFGRKFGLPRNWELELESGIRWSEFNEKLRDSDDIVRFKETWAKQAGTVFGGDLVKRILPGMSAFIQGHISYNRTSYFRQSGVQNDAMRRNLHSYEGMAGLQFDHRTQNGSNLFFRAGYAYFNNQNLGSSFDNGNDETYAGFRDMDLSGLVFRFGVRR